jgi:hypothetical protein
MGELTFSPFQLDFISYRHSKLDILEGPSGCGKTAAAFPKFIDEVIHSKNSHHILACKDIQKTEQNILNNQDIGLPIFEGVATYYPRGKGLNTTSHVLVKGADGRDKVILLVTYSDSGKWEKIHGGWYGCTLIDEVNLVPSEDPEEISQFVTHSLQRTREHSIWTLNPDDPSKPIYKIINRARPITKYKNKGPKEIRNLLCEEENPDYKWWFFDRSDNPVMTPEIEKQIYEAYKGTKQYDSMYLGLRLKTCALAFPSFDENNYTTENEVLEKVYNRDIRWKSFSVGLDTSYSSKTDDLIALVFVGITTDKKVYVLDEFTFNNRDVKKITDKMTASTLAPVFYEFLHKNSKKWGIPEYCFVDEADQNTILELAKYGDLNHEPFKVCQSRKQLWKIPSRMRKIDELIGQKRYFVVKDNCPENIRELNVMSIDPKDKSRPEDKNNHTYDALCYALELEYLKGGI